MPKKFNGNSSKNARIKIDYKDKNPKVNFSYPSKKHQKEFSMLPIIYLYWIIICFTPFFLILIWNLDSEKTIDLNNHTQCLSYYDDYKYEHCEELSMGMKDYFYSQIKELKSEFDLKVLLLILLLIVPPLLIYFPFKQRWKDYFPKFQGKQAKKKLVVFKPKDIRKDGMGYFVEIPVFENIILNYKATKEFSKYLNLCEIREHNFKYVVSKKLKGDEKKKEELNEWIWYARFSFSKKPTTGQLSVLFK